MQLRDNYILDSERNEGSSGFIIVFIFFYPVYKMSTRRSAVISTYNILSFKKLDQDDTLKRL